MEQSTPDLLQEYENEIILEPASVGIRFLNFLIDWITYCVILFIGGVIWGISMAAQGMDAYERLQAIKDTEVARFFISIGVILAYFVIFEGASKGRTLGKLITGTVAVKEDGSPIDFKDALVRSLCRLIPFEPFSAFGYRPWHDRIANTWVIKKPR